MKRRNTRELSLAAVPFFNVRPEVSLRRKSRGGTITSASFLLRVSLFEFQERWWWWWLWQRQRQRWWRWRWSIAIQSGCILEFWVEWVEDCALEECVGEFCRWCTNPFVYCHYNNLTLTWGGCGSAFKVRIFENGILFSRQQIQTNTNFETMGCWSTV